MPKKKSITNLNTPVVYGPVASRRLGRSLGINLFAPQARVCNFNCIYCQCGKPKTAKKRILPFTTIKKDLTENLAKIIRLGTPIDYMTFAGNGEPTIHPEFPKIVNFVLKQREKFFPKTPLAIFTNCTMLNKEMVRKAISKLDRRLLKLDASDKTTMQTVNQYKNFDRILDGIYATAKKMPVEISTAVIKSPKNFANIDSIKNQDFVEIIKKINPVRVCLYSIDRPPAESEIKQTPKEELLKLVVYLNKHFKIPVQALRSRRTRRWSQWIWE